MNKTWRRELYKSEATLTANPGNFPVTFPF